MYFRASGPARLTDFVLCPAGSLSTSKAYSGTLTDTMFQEDNVGGRCQMTPTIYSLLDVKPRLFNVDVQFTDTTSLSCVDMTGMRSYLTAEHLKV